MSVTNIMPQTTLCRHGFGIRSIISNRNTQVMNLVRPQLSISLGLGFWDLGLGFGFCVLGLGFWVLFFWFWVLGFGFWVSVF